MHGLPNISNVDTDAAAFDYFRSWRRHYRRQVEELSTAAGTMSAMLKPHDAWKGSNRRKYVTRPLLAAAALAVLSSKAMTLAASRFDKEYGDEIAGRPSREQRRRRSGLRFGG